jgi:hypothetical protein
VKLVHLQFLQNKALKESCFFALVRSFKTNGVGSDGDASDGRAMKFIRPG